MLFVFVVLQMDVYVLKEWLFVWGWGGGCLVVGMCGGWGEINTCWYSNCPDTGLYILTMDLHRIVCACMCVCVCACMCACVFECVCVRMCEWGGGLLK